jgi:hypothetical protein
VFPGCSTDRRDPATLVGMSNLRALSHRWPSALGLLVAVWALVTEPDTESIAITVAIAAVCYLGAAALNRRWVAWAGIPAGTVVVVLAELMNLPWWVALGVAGALLVVIGLFTGVSRGALSAQTLALLGFGGLAVVGLFLAPTVGLVVVGAVLASHAIWDAVHYWSDKVVSRSLAEFCMLLDVPLGVGVIVIALTG